MNTNMTVTRGTKGTDVVMKLNKSYRPNTNLDKFEGFVKSIVNSFILDNSNLPFMTVISLPVVYLEDGKFDILHLEFSFCMYANHKLYSLHLNKHWVDINLSNYDTAIKGFYKEFIKLGVRLTEESLDINYLSTINKPPVNNRLFIENVIRIVHYLECKLYGIPKSTQLSYLESVKASVYHSLRSIGFNKDNGLPYDMEYTWKICSKSEIVIHFYSEGYNFSGISFEFYDLKIDSLLSTIYPNNTEELCELDLKNIYAQVISIMNENLIRINPETTFK